MVTRQSVFQKTNKTNNKNSSKVSGVSNHFNAFGAAAVAAALSALYVGLDKYREVLASSVDIHVARLGEQLKKEMSSAREEMRVSIKDHSDKSSKSIESWGQNLSQRLDCVYRATYNTPSRLARGKSDGARASGVYT